MTTPYFVETFTPEERAVLAQYVTNLDGPVFALKNLPQVTAAALFARYSRSPKSLRRLLLDEFLTDLSTNGKGSGNAGAEKAGELFGRVLSEYGDDSVAQLAGVHLACEQVSQPLIKAIEWGRLSSYLEQSTRYIPYTDRRDGNYRYFRDPEVMNSMHGATYVAAMDTLFDTYASLIDPLRDYLDQTLPQEEDVAARKRALRALALDMVRGLLPAGTVSNTGVFASPQAMEQLVLRLRAHPVPEANAYAELINAELQKVIPEFVTRLDRPDRGGVWQDYIQETAEGLRTHAAALTPSVPQPAPASVELVDWDRDGEEQIIASALYPYMTMSKSDVRAAVDRLSAEQRAEFFRAATGARRNRRHRPGRGFEDCSYTFEIVSDYGAFRDLQRHRMLTMQWQQLTPYLGYDVPEQVIAAGLADKWHAAARQAEAAYETIRADFPEQAAYVVTLAHRVRYQMTFNAREAMHMIELRTSPQGHPSYRKVCREMHRLIDEVAGHHLVAGAMGFVGQADVHLPRYAAEAKGKVGATAAG